MAQSSYPDSTFLIDPPGVVRGVAGAELLISLVDILAIDAIIVLYRTAELPLESEILSLSVPFFFITAASAAKRPTKFENAKWRTRLWNEFIGPAKVEAYDIRTLHCIGTPPSCDIYEAWRGKQIALLDMQGNPVGIGEVCKIVDTLLIAKIVRSGSAQATTLLIRDAGRNNAGHLATIAPPLSDQTSQHAPADMGGAYLVADKRSPPLSSHTGTVWATLIGGIFGDPLLHVRFRNQKRSFLFDLGASSRLQARIAHQVEAVFLSHAHLDHIAGFIWFLRSRLGPFGPCRIFGPEGIIKHLEHFMAAVTWDRIADLGPVFVVAEIQGNELVQSQLQPGRKSVPLGTKVIENGIIMADDNLNVRAAICDHKIPSIAYSLEFVQMISIRKERLQRFDLTAGPWLGQLKQCIAANSFDAVIALPDGSERSARDLADDLAIITPGKKLVYAADMADSEENRRELIRLACGAHTLFCEAAFANADRDKAAATQHLTTMATAQIAKFAGVRHLVPFHFSKRYEFSAQLLYKEICAEAGSVRVIGADSIY
jgi:ribonuclease BN (tRNA processing enzyme)